MARISNGQVESDNQRKYEVLAWVGTTILGALVTYVVAKNKYEEMVDEIEF